MSTLTVTNIKATGEAASRAVSGVAAAWINFDGDAGTNTIRDSNNATSLVDNGIGDYSFSYVSSLSNDDYSAVCSASNQAASNTDTMVNPYTWATGSLSIGTNNNAGTITDRNTVNVTIHGDLA